MYLGTNGAICLFKDVNEDTRSSLARPNMIYHDAAQLKSPQANSDNVWLL